VTKPAPFSASEHGVLCNAASMLPRKQDGWDHHCDGGHITLVNGMSLLDLCQDLSVMFLSFFDMYFATIFRLYCDKACSFFCI
jgi:hypothetical protein